MPKPKKITTEELAVMIKRGFDETAKKVDMEARFEETATKQDVADIRRDITRIENILIEGLQRRLERVEDDMRLVKTKARIS